MKRPPNARDSLWNYFPVDKREIALSERLRQYYRDTPDEMDNRTAMKHWQAFEQWCNDHRYTQDEINRVKSLPMLHRYTQDEINRVKIENIKVNE